MSKVEGGGVRDNPPSKLRVTIFYRRLLGLNLTAEKIILSLAFAARL